MACHVACAVDRIRRAGEQCRRVQGLKIAPLGRISVSQPTLWNPQGRSSSRKGQGHFMFSIYILMCGSNMIWKMKSEGTNYRELYYYELLCIEL